MIASFKDLMLEDLRRAQRVILVHPPASGEVEAPSQLEKRGRCIFAPDRQ